MLVNWLQVSVRKQQHERVFMCWECRLRRLLQLHEKLPKVGKLKSSGPSNFWRIWHLLTTLGVALVNNIEHECFRISHPKSPPLSSENKLVFCFANQQKHIHLCWENNGRNPKLSSACSSLSEETALLRITAHISDNSWYKPQNPPARNHDQPLSRWWHFCRLSTNGNFPSLEKWGIHFFPKMSTAPLFISIPTSHPVKSSFCAGVQFSRDPICGFNDRKKIRENRGLWTVYVYSGSSI